VFILCVPVLQTGGNRFQWQIYLANAWFAFISFLASYLLSARFRSFLSSLFFFFKIKAWFNSITSSLFHLFTYSFSFVLYFFLFLFVRIIAVGVVAVSFIKYIYK